MGFKIPGVRKGQSEIMEYMLMVVFIVAAIIGIILFLTWWSGQQMEVESFKNKQDRVTSIAKSMMVESMLVDSQSIFDDAKLTSVNAVSGCDNLQDMYGKSWYAVIRSLDMPGEINCSWGGYPDCNTWRVCNYPSQKKSLLVQKFPVNVYRKLSDRVSFAILEVGVYS